MGGDSSKSKQINTTQQTRTNQTSERLAISIANQCTEVRTVKGMKNFKLSLKELVNIHGDGGSSFVKRFSMGQPVNPNRFEYNTSKKTILLIGETGSGKTTMINAMINYILGVEWKDNFRFKLIDEDVKRRSRAHNQAQGITAYDIHYRVGFRIPFSLTIIETPGFGSPGGMVRDNEIPLNIEKLFKDEYGIKVLDAVCFVVKSPDERLTDLKKNIFNSVLNIFGEDVRDNIRFLVTFAHVTRQPVLTAIKEAQIPCQLDSNGWPCHQKFNNGTILIKPKNDDEMSYIEWKNTIKNLEFFFDELSVMPTKSLQITQDILQTRRCLETQLDHATKVMKSRLLKHEHLRKIEKIILQNEHHFNNNREVEVEVPMMIKEKVVVDEKSALNCKKCQVTCHYPCRLIPFTIPFCPAFIDAENFKAVCKSVSKIYFENFSESAVIENTLNTISTSSLSNLYCCVCPGKCPSSAHKYENTRWDYVESKAHWTLRKIGEDYKDEMGNPLSAEEARKKLKEEIDQEEEKILKSMSNITLFLNFLKKIDLQKDTLLTTPEYIEMIITNEAQIFKPGYELRIQSLRMVLEKSKLFADFNEKNSK